MSTRPLTVSRTENGPRTSRSDWLNEALGHAARYLPAQAPLEVFVHHNPLHAFEHLPFHDAVAAASAKLGAQGYLSEAHYRAAYHAGRIDESDVDAALAAWWPAELPGLHEALPEARE